MHFFHQLVGGRWDWKQHGILVARNEVDYKRSILLRDKVKIYVGCKHIGTKSFTMDYKIVVVENDQETGYIYILKSKSEKPEIKEFANLYKIGFSTVEVEERIKNASQEATYLMADVSIVMAFKCYNMNPQRFEQLLHTFFGKACLNIDVFDKNGNRHTPREWFIAPLAIIEQAIHYIISGDIIHYGYDSTNEQIVAK